MGVIPEHFTPRFCDRLKTDDGCYWCCNRCNYNNHQCPGCGDPLTHLDNNLDGTPHVGCVD